VPLFPGCPLISPHLAIAWRTIRRCNPCFFASPLIVSSAALPSRPTRVMNGAVERLRGRLDQGISWQVKRQLLEALVGGIRVDTTEEGGKKSASLIVTYWFASSIATCTGMRACSNWSLERVYRPPIRSKAA
jgi:hypothetical protein